MTISPALRRCRAPGRSSAAWAMLLLAGSSGLLGCSTPVEAPSVPQNQAPAPAPPEAVGAPDASPVFAWRCDDDARLVTRYVAADGSLELSDDGARYTLAAVRSASGARWSDGRLGFFSKADEALLERGDVTVPCSRNGPDTVDARAAMAGVRFRAAGNEPGWSLEVHDDRMEWSGAYGADRRTFTLDGSDEPSAGERRVRGRSDDMVIEAIAVDDVCRDDADRSWPARVEVRLEDRTLRGCGRALVSPFAETGGLLSP